MSAERASKLETCEKGSKTREAKTGKTCGQISQICLQVLRTAVCPLLSSKTRGQNLQNLPGNRQNPKVSVGAGARIHAPLQKRTGKARRIAEAGGGPVGNTTHAADRVWDATGRADGQADGDGAQPRRRGVSPYLGRTDILLRWSSPLTALPLPRRAAQVSSWTAALPRAKPATRARWRNATRRAQSSVARRTHRPGRPTRKGRGGRAGEARGVALGDRGCRRWGCGGAAAGAGRHGGGGPRGARL